MADTTIKAKLILDTSSGLGARTTGTTGGLAGGLSGQGIGGLTKSLGSIGKILGSILFVLEAFKAPLMMLGQIASLLAMFLKPISDVVVWFLKPLIGILLRLLVPYLKAWNAKKESQTPQKIVGDMALASLGPIGTNVIAAEEIAPKVYEKIKTWLSEGWSTLTKFYQAVKDVVGPWLQDSWSEAKTLYEEIYGVMESWLTSTWEKAKTLYEEVYSYVSSWISKGWDTVESFASMVVSKAKEWISSTISSFTSSKSSSGSGGGIMSSIVSTAKKVGKFITGGDVIVTNDGKVIQLDPKDNIMATKNGVGGGGSYSITINVNALDASSINQSTINKITSAMTEQLKRGTLGRSSYAIGV